MLCSAFISTGNRQNASSSIFDFEGSVLVNMIIGYFPSSLHLVMLLAGIVPILDFVAPNDSAMTATMGAPNFGSLLVQSNLALTLQVLQMAPPSLSSISEMSSFDYLTNRRHFLQY